MTSFFKKHRVSKPNCPNCGLGTQCVTPRMKVSGKGKKGILIITKAPTIDEDKVGKPFIDKTSVYLKRELQIAGIDLENDCWKVHAVCCRTPINAKGDGTTDPTSAMVDSCRPYINNLIKELNPSKIFLFGNTALTSFYGNRNSNCTTINKMNGLKLWDSTYNAWVFPLWHPAYVEKANYDGMVGSEWRRCIIRAADYTSKPLKKIWNKINVLKYFDQAKEALENCLRDDLIIAVDYETTGLTMYQEGHSTVSFAWANSKAAYSIPLQHPCFTLVEQTVLLDLVRKILNKRKIKKIVQGINFEYPWTKRQLGVEPRSIFWDTQLATHVLDNRTGITGLKFQAFMRWGIEEYDALSKNYIKSDATGFNNMLKMPIDALLKYNAYDALYTYALYEEQLGEFEGRELEAYKFLHAGAITMCELSLNGMSIKKEYYLRQKAILEKERDTLIEKINNSDETKMYSKRFGGAFDYNSPKDLQKMLFQVLGLTPIKKTKTGESVDEEVLVKLDIQLTKDIIAIRKLNKMIGTYVDGFLGFTYDGEMHPSFSLSRARTYRSSSQSPNFQNIPKRDPKAKRITRSGIVPRPGRVLGEMDFSGAEISTSCVTIDTVVETIHGPMAMGDLLTRLKEKDTYVYCYNTTKGRIGVSKVTDGGITGKDREIWEVTLDNGEVVKATPDHKFMLRDESYVELRNLSVGDSLMPFYKEHKRRACDAVSYTDLYLNNGEHTLAHNLIAEDVYGVVIKGSNLLVHHKDSNGVNNDPSNLEIMNRAKHMAIHAKQGWKSKPSGARSIDRERLSKSAIELNRKRKEEWTEEQWHEFSCRVSEGVQNKNNGNRGEFNPMYGKKQSQKCRDAVSAANSGRSPWCKGLKLGPISEELRKAITVPCTEERRRKISDTLKGRPLSEGHKLALSGIPKSEEHKKKIAEAKKEWWDGKLPEVCHICKQEFKVVTNTHLKSWHGITLKEYREVHNHKVVAIRKVGAEDVYNINVEGTHNYALAAGVIVKNCYYHKDPTFIKYQTEGGGDMHKDASAEILKTKPEHIPKQIRQATKGIWTFAQFYGSYYVSCAKQGWEEYPQVVDEEGEPVTIDGVSIVDHIKGKFRSYKAFEKHLKDFERKFWNEWFPVYTGWKEQVANQYKKTGYVETFLGFRFKGVMDTKTCSNYPVQSTSFHLLLYTATKFVKIAKKRKLKTLAIGQVHDSLILDIPLDEIEIVHGILKEIVGSLHEVFPWMDFPMGLDFEISDSYEQGGSFASMRKVK